MLREHKKLKEKTIEIQKKEDLEKYMKKRKSEAFDIMDDAQNLLIQGEYDKSIEEYLNAELILNEINFPTSSVREMISKVQEKKKELDLNQFKEIELKIRRDQEKEKAFKILEEAQKQIEQGNYDKTIELYHNAIELFRTIQWDEEIDLIQNSIIEVENKKRDAEIKKQQELQLN